jgi:AraC-like DNA-binding protein
MTVLGDPAAGDRGRFRVFPGFGGTALFDADFHNFTFAPHFHDTLMLGFILAGRKQFVRDKVLHDATVGDMSVANPGDVHTGGVAGADQLLRYTSVYPSSALLAEAGLPESADFRVAVVNDNALAPVFAHALAAATPPAEAEEALLIALAGLAERHGEGRRRLPAASPKAVARAVEYINDAISDPLRLEDIAARAEVSPRHLIRCFRSELGLTPQAYVRQARVHNVSNRLRNGETPAAAAASAGFADQPHMTRAFRTVMGITPAAYARSWREMH